MFRGVEERAVARIDGPGECAPRFAFVARDEHGFVGRPICDVLEDHGQPGYREKLARKIDDHEPQNWLTPEQCERELGLADEAP